MKELTDDQKSVLLNQRGELKIKFARAIEQTVMKSEGTDFEVKRRRRVGKIIHNLNVKEPLTLLLDTLGYKYTDAGTSVKTSKAAVKTMKELYEEY